MNRALVIALVCACGKSESRPPLSIAAEISGEAKLVVGTRQVGLRVGNDGWWTSEAGTLVEHAEIGAAIANETTGSGESDTGHLDIFLGLTPILFGGQEHAETIVRVPSRTAIELAGEPLEVIVIGKREAWLVREGIADKVVFVDDTHVEPAPPLALAGPPADTVSPVSAKLCAKPKVEDIAALGDEVYALVTECNDDAPIRIVIYPSGRVAVLPSRKHLGMSFAKLVVSRDGKMHLAGIRDGRFEIEHVLEDMTYKRASTTFAATRVEAAVVADDGAIWALVLDAGGKRQVLRYGAVVALPSEPKGLGFDDKLGVVVLTANSLLAERPGKRVVIAPPR